MNELKGKRRKKKSEQEQLPKVERKDGSYYPLHYYLDCPFNICALQII